MERIQRHQSWTVTTLETQSCAGSLVLKYPASLAIQPNPSCSPHGIGYAKAEIPWISYSTRSNKSVPEMLPILRTRTTAHCASLSSFPFDSQVVDLIEKTMCLFSLDTPSWILIVRSQDGDTATCLWAHFSFHIHGRVVLVKTTSNPTTNRLETISGLFRSALSDNGAGAVAPPGRGGRREMGQIGEPVTLLLRPDSFKLNNRSVRFSKKN
ncbi:hypothetical protein V8F06_000032 [Rhypophila decipiens]